MGQRPDELVEYESSVGGGHEGESGFAETTAAAREELELTRADMTSTLDAIQERLDPEIIAEHAKDTAQDVTDYAIREARQVAREIIDHARVQATEAVRDVTGQATLALRASTIGKVEMMARNATDTAGGLRQTVVETIKANPMPATVVGLCLGWMLLNRPSGSGSLQGAAANAAEHTAGQVVAVRAQETVGQVADQVQGTAGHLIDKAQGTADQVMDQVHETSGQMFDQVLEQASRAQGFLQRQLEANPLLVGAVAVTVGGVLAGTVRSTPRENQLLGDTRDRLMGTARDLTQETMHKVGRVVDEAQQAATREARKQSLVPEDGSPGNAS